MLPCACARAASDALRFMMLVSGGVGRGPSHHIRRTKQNPLGLAKAKRVALERKLHKGTVLLPLARDAPSVGGVCRVRNWRMPACGAGEDASRARGIDFGYRGSGCRGGCARKEGSGESDSDIEVLSQCKSDGRIGALPQEGRRFKRVTGHLAGSKRAIGSRRRRELTPRVVGSISPA
ncbi:hypothetical protein ERJ75_000391100 [Trypanosoma vivax]|nr:hypothetical protein ERJ75_000391100 [Trypanosoma vivax]